MQSLAPLKILLLIAGFTIGLVKGRDMGWFLAGLIFLPVLLLGFYLALSKGLRALITRLLR